MGKKKKKKHTSPQAQTGNPVVISRKKFNRQTVAAYLKRWGNTVKATYSDIYTL